MFILREVLLDRDDAAEASMECAEKAMPITDKACMMDSTHWQTYPGAGLLGPALAIHWRVMRTFKACISPINISTLTSVSMRQESTLSLISLLRLNSLLGSSGQTPLLILHHRDQVKAVAIYQTSSSFWICANSVLHGGSHMLLALNFTHGNTRERSGLVNPTRGTSE